MTDDLKERVGDIWRWHSDGWFVGITTNGVVKRNGECVMGRGVALDARDKFPGFAKELGTHIRQHGNVVGMFPHHKIFTFPVKYRWNEPADLDLIEQSARDLHRILGILRHYDADFRYAMVRPGCGNGTLAWNEVRQVVAPWLADACVTIVNPTS